MKGKKFYIILIGLIVIGISAFTLYQQKQEERILAFEGYEISSIEERVDALYNEEKTDIAPDISEKELEELDGILSDLSERELTNQSETRIRNTYLDLSMAREMFYIQQEVLDLFEEKGLVAETISLKDVEGLQEEVEGYNNKLVYYERNIERVEEARKQLIAIETATAFVESLFDEEGYVLEDVTREDEEKALELISEIKHPDLKKELTAQVETVSLALDEAEEALALEEALDEQEALEEEEELEELEELEETAGTEELEDESAPASSNNTESSTSWRPRRSSSSGGSSRSESSTQTRRPSSSGGSSNPGGSDSGTSTGETNASEEESSNETPPVTDDDAGSDEEIEEEFEEKVNPITPEDPVDEPAPEEPVDEEDPVEEPETPTMPHNEDQM